MGVFVAEEVGWVEKLEKLGQQETDEAELDQDRIFEGFYPVQDTESYSSRRPYSFNAGGKGIDLLRIRMFSELYGFRLSFTSRRCSYLTDSLQDGPGEVVRCPHCSHQEDCVNSGGSEFVVDFPLAAEDNPQESIRQSA